MIESLQIRNNPAARDLTIFKPDLLSFPATEQDFYVTICEIFVRGHVTHQLKDIEERFKKCVDQHQLLIYF